VCGSLALGLACFSVPAILIEAKSSEDEVWAGWLVTTALAAFGAGYAWPRFFPFGAC
jgi:hypothetical protein